MLLSSARSFSSVPVRPLRFSPRRLACPLCCGVVGSLMNRFTRALRSAQWAQIREIRRRHHILLVAGLPCSPPSTTWRFIRLVGWHGGARFPLLGHGLSSLSASVRRETAPDHCLRSHSRTASISRARPRAAACESRGSGLRGSSNECRPPPLALLSASLLSASRLQRSRCQLGSRRAPACSRGSRSAAVNRALGRWQLRGAEGREACGSLGICRAASSAADAAVSRALSRQSPWQFPCSRVSSSPCPLRLRPICLLGRVARMLRV